MQLGSYCASVLLHSMLVLMVLLWPVKPRLDLSQAVQISLVDGAPGGELRQSPVLGHQGDLSAPPKAEPKPAPEAPPPQIAPEAMPQEVRARVESEPLKTPVELPRPESAPQPAPPPPPPPDTATPISERKVEQPPQPQPKPEAKPETAPKPEPPKPAETKKTPEVSRDDAIRAALADAQRQALGPSQSARQDAVARALNEAARQSRRGTGGGGGEGEGPGGGGLKNVYIGLVILAVRPNWSYSNFTLRENIVVTVRIKLDPAGNVLDCYVERSSGNPAFDTSAVNAIIRTKVLPPPPTAEEQDLSIGFNSQEFGG
jgi:TonB family protein